MLYNNSAKGRLFSGVDLQKLQKESAETSRDIARRNEEIREKVKAVDHAASKLIIAAIRMSRRTDAPSYIKDASLDYIDALEAYKDNL